MSVFESSQKLTRGFYSRPAISFSIYFLIIALIAIIPAKSMLLSIMLFLSPWIILFLMILNLPFIAATFRKFRMPKCKKRNHAMEHVTIHFLSELYGQAAGIGGAADFDGFRLSGIKDKKDINSAIKKISDLMDSKQLADHLAVSKYCGSNIITAQAFGTILLTVSGILFFLFNFEVQLAVSILTFNILSYFLLRYPLGSWIQKHFFLSFDFEAVHIKSIRKVPKKFFEKKNAYFIETSFQ